MNVSLIVVGKTDEAYLNDGISQYIKRLKHYVNFCIEEIPALKTGQISISQQKEKEGDLIISKISNGDFVVLLDEQGKNLNSIEFSHFFQLQMNSGKKKVVFLIGGPFGFSDKIYGRADYKLSLSKMTFSHQMVRLFFVEQVYRAFSILKGEKYHHV